MLNKQRIMLNTVPDGTPPVVYVSQDDIGREIQLVLVDGNEAMALKSTYTYSIRGTKSSGTGFVYDGTIDVIGYNTVEFKTTSTMTAAAGPARFGLLIFDNGEHIETLNFILFVQKAALDAETIVDESDFESIISQAINTALNTQVSTLTEAAEDVTEAVNTFTGMDVEVTGLESGATPTASYSNGTLTLGIPAGDKGDTGETGATGETGPTGPDGVSPTVAISTITGGHRVTITDATHPNGQSFDVMDGEQDVFWATYDTTTATEISVAKNANKVIFCNYNGVIYRYESTLIAGMSYAHYFYANYYTSTNPKAGVLAYVRCIASNSNPSGVWSDGNFSVTPASINAIELPSSATAGDFLCFNGTTWAATSMSAWQGGNY